MIACAILGCSTSSNRFQFANSRRSDRDRLAELDRNPPPASPAIAAVPESPPLRNEPFDPPSAGALREQLQAPGNSAPPFEPPRQNSDFAGNRTRTIETPRPSSPGSTMVQAANGPELSGRVVNAMGRPEGGVSIGVAMVARPSQVVAEVATGPDGSFRVSFLDPGIQYRLTASVVSAGRRMVGSVVATPPDTAVVIQLDREDGAGFSAIGNRSGQATPSKRPSIPTSFASSNDAAFATLAALGPDGRSTRLGDFPGNLILLDFFGSWCEPCRRSIPTLNALQRRFGSRGLALVGLACESGNANQVAGQLRGIASRLNIEYPLLACSLDEKSQLRDFFNVERYPTLILLDRGGRVLFRHSGTDQESFRRLEQIVAANVDR